MWSVRAVVEAVVEQGRRALHQQVRRRQPHHHPYPRPQHPGHKLSKGVREGAGEAAAGGCVSGRAGVVASRLRPFTTQLFQSIFRKVPAPLWTEARRRTTQRLVFGASAPYFALVGVTLVGGSQGLVTRDDELEALCGTVREAITRSGWLHNPEFWRAQREGSEQREEQAHQEDQEEQEQRGEEGHVFSLTDFTLGPVIDKGCNAAVYAARWKPDENSNHHRHQQEKEEEEQPLSYSSTIRQVVQGLPVPQESVTGRLGNPSMAASFMQSQGHTENTEADLADGLKPESTPGKNGTQGAVARTPATAFAPYEEERQEEGREEAAVGGQHQEFPLAIKMMFNYEAESNAPAILRAMYKEILPARSVQLDPEQQEWQERLCGPRVCLR